MLYRLTLLCPGDSKGYGCDPDTDAGPKSRHRFCRVHLRIEVTRDAASNGERLLARLSEVGSHGANHRPGTTVRTYYQTKILTHGLFANNATASQVRSGR